MFCLGLEAAISIAKAHEERNFYESIKDSSPHIREKLIADRALQEEKRRKEDIEVRMHKELCDAIRDSGRKHINKPCSPSIPSVCGIYSGIAAGIILGQMV